MVLKRVTRRLWVIVGILVVLGVAIALLQDPEGAEQCELLMVAYESNTADRQELARLDAGCPGWESMR